MPWRLVPPRKDKTPYWYVRGKYLGIALDRSTGTSERRAAATIFSTWKRQAERGEFSRPAEKDEPELFLSAAKAYMLAGGERQYVEAICNKWSAKMLADIDQIAIDMLANEPSRANSMCVDRPGYDAESASTSSKNALTLNAHAEVFGTNWSLVMFRCCETNPCTA